MSVIKEQERIEELKRRLYERGARPLKSEPHALHDIQNDVATSWQKPPEPLPTQPEPVEEIPPMIAKKRARNYRLKLALAGVGFFAFALILSSAFLFFGNRNISGENITLSVTGPFTIGGGEMLSLQVGIANGNVIPIESATLIVQYPSGTKSADDETKDLFIERLPLETIGSGETLNLPMRAIIFGEENEDKEIRVSIEYRVQGSSATFFKEAEPLRLKVSSSPVVLRADSLKQLASGAETTIELTVVSNAQNELSEILVQADYPSGFDFTRAEPAPTNGNNSWLISNLEPESSQKIVITGVAIGRETDEYAVNFSIGVPDPIDRQRIAAVFATAQTRFEIEAPFLDVSLQIARSSDQEVVLSAGSEPSAVLEIKNTLNETVYDASVLVKVTGNAMADPAIVSPFGYYDSNTRTLILDTNNYSDMREIPPGVTRRINFSLRLRDDSIATPQAELVVDVKARRINERGVQEEITRSIERSIKISGEQTLQGETGYNVTGFTASGPIPPQVGEDTSYVLSLRLENGSNAVTDGEVTATLPTYVTWQNETRGNGTVTYNQTDRTVTWRFGDLASHAAATVSMQVSLLPSSQQIGTTPTLLNQQNFRATDRFTGLVVRGSAPALTTEMSREAGHERGNGRVEE